MSLNLVLSVNFPDLSYLSPISSIFLLLSSTELSKALVGMSGKRACRLVFSGFRQWLPVSRTPLILRGSRHLQYPWNNFSFGEMSLNMVLLDMFLTLHTSRLAYFFHIPFTVIQRTLEGPGGNEWAKEMFGFLWLSTIVASFSGSSVLVA